MQFGRSPKRTSSFWLTLEREFAPRPVRTIEMNRIEQMEYGGRVYRKMTPEQLLAAGVPQTAIDAHLAALRLASIKVECRRRINLVVTGKAQKAIAAAFAAISEKPVGSRRTEERSSLAQAELTLGWVAAMRANVDVLAADTGMDIHADSSWPPCPPGVKNYAARF